MCRGSARRLACAVVAACALGAGAALILAPRATAEPLRATASALPHVARRIAKGDPLRIVAFGSSSTEGVGASSPAAAYPSRLEDFLEARLPGGVQVVNAGVGGQDADDMLRRMPAVVAMHPDLVIWQTGSNDPLRHLPLSRFTAETLRGVTMLRGAGIDVMLMEAQDSRRLQAEPEAPRFRVALRTIAAQLQVPLVRRYDLMRDWLAKGALTPAELMSPDGLHMADRGYARLAVAVGEQILALGGQGRGAPGNGSRTAPRS
jgi:acyl-CoA thioesterase-1